MGRVEVFDAGDAGADLPLESFGSLQVRAGRLPASDDGDLGSPGSSAIPLFQRPLPGDNFGTDLQEVSLGHSNGKRHPATVQQRNLGDIWSSFGCDQGQRCSCQGSAWSSRAL